MFLDEIIKSINSETHNKHPGNGGLMVLQQNFIDTFQMN